MKILLLGSSIIKHWKDFTTNQTNEHVINVGKSGLVTTNLTKYLEKIPLIEPEYIILYCGGNDLLCNVNKIDVVNNLQSFLDDLLTKFPNSKIIILSLIKSPIMKDKTKEIDYINNNIRKYSNNHSNTIYLNVNKILSKKEYFQKDGLHLNTIGYERMNNKLHTFL
jgi:lysophospholipase L1-like esterase